MCNDIRLGPRPETDKEFNKRFDESFRKLMENLKMSIVRCKFVCNSKREYKSGADTCYDYEFTAVYGDKSEENKRFWKWTPAGKLNVSTVFNDQFQPGKEYYLDLIEA